MVKLLSSPANLIQMSYIDSTTGNQRSMRGLDNILEDPREESSNTSSNDTFYTNDTSQAESAWCNDEVENVYVPQTIEQEHNSIPCCTIDPKPKIHQNLRCVVCNLEKNMMKLANVKDVKGQGSERSRHNLGKCSSCDGSLWLHNQVAPCKQKIFLMAEFQGLTCHEIYHSDVAAGLWSFQMKNGIRYNQRNNNHWIYKHLREQYGLSESPTQKRKHNSDDEGNHDNSNGRYEDDYNGRNEDVGMIVSL